MRGPESLSGPLSYINQFSGIARRLGIRSGVDGGLKGEDARRAAAGLVLVRVNLDVLPR
jgi:hypothetical protein